LKKKNKAGGITIPGFKLYYKPVVIKTVWYWHQNRYISIEQDRKPRNKPRIIWSIIFNKRGKNMQWEKECLLKKW